MVLMVREDATNVRTATKTDVVMVTELNQLLTATQTPARTALKEKDVQTADRPVIGPSNRMVRKMEKANPDHATTTTEGEEITTEVA